MLLLQEVIQRLGLRHGARKAIENETVLHVRLVETIGNDADHDLIRHQPAAGHDVLGLEADRCLRGHRRPQHFSGRELDDAMLLDQPLRLRSLARARRPRESISWLFAPRRSVSERPRTL